MPRHVIAHRAEFTGVKRIAREPTIKPFNAQALVEGVWTGIGAAATQTGAEAIARGYRTDNRGALTRITERRRPGGFAYIAV